MDEQDANHPQGCSSPATAAGDGATDADFHRWIPLSGSNLPRAVTNI